MACITLITQRGAEVPMSQWTPRQRRVREPQLVSNRGGRLWASRTGVPSCLLICCCLHRSYSPCPRLQAYPPLKDHQNAHILCSQWCHRRTALGLSEEASLLHVQPLSWLSLSSSGAGVLRARSSTCG